MTWKDDGHGIACRPAEVKVYHNGHHTWGMKLSQLNRQYGVVRIITYSLPNVEYAVNLLGKRPQNIFVVCHAKFIERARAIKKALPEIRIAIAEELHAKMLMIEPKTVYIGSSNFGHSNWQECEVGIRDNNVHDACTKTFERLWQQATEVAVV